MQYTTELLAKHLGKKFNPEAAYLIETHSGAMSRVLEGTHKSVGEVPDFSLNEKGTMVVLERRHTPKEHVDSGTSSIEAPTNIPLGQRCIATPVQTVLPPNPPKARNAPDPTPKPEPKVEAKPIWDKPPVKQTNTTNRGAKPLGGKKK